MLLNNRCRVRSHIRPLPALLLTMLMVPISSGCRPEAKPSATSATSEGGSAPQNAGGSTLDFRLVATPALESWSYQSGREAGLNSILETIGGGVACLDYDLDGHCDLFFPGGGQIAAEQQAVRGVPSLLLRGGSEWSFEDVSKAANVTVHDLYTHGAAAADYNNDGFVDLLVGGYRGVRLLRNQGDSSFQDVTAEAGLADAPWTTAIAWLDVNQDGMLDLYLGSYVDWEFGKHRTCPNRDGRADVCGPNVYEVASSAVYQSLGDGRFKDVSKSKFSSLDGKALSALGADLDADGSAEIYVANDLLPNYLFSRQGQQFEDHGVAAGVAVDAAGQANGSMGVALLDFNLDQRFDLLVTNFEHEQIAAYQNEGGLLFRHVSRNFRVNALEGVVGFGVVAADFDCDGDEDVLMTSGHVQYYPDSGRMEQPPYLLENMEGCHLSRYVPRRCTYLNRRSTGRGLAVGDLDNDGDVDAVVTHLFAPPALLENTRRNAHSWLRLGLVGRESSRTPIGAVVTLKVDERLMVRQLYGGGSYLSQSQSELFFGWEEDAAADVTVAWPSGRLTNLQNVAPGQALILVEP